MNLKKKFLKNLSYAITSQGISLLMSMLINLFLPKVLGVEDFSYWQLFIFYSQYIPFLHLGLNDGVYLRYGGIKFKDLNKNIIKTQLILGLFYQLIFCIILCFMSWVVVLDYSRLTIIILVTIYFIFYSIQNYLGNIFQATNEFIWFSKSIILSQIFFIVVMIICLYMDKKQYWIYIMIYIFSQIVSSIYLIVKGKKIVLAKICYIKISIKELLLNINAGIKLMLANIASMLVLGSSRQIIDMIWGLLVFGKISFAITLSNFLLVFIRQIGLVMFPTLKQLNENTQRYIYDLSRKGLFLFLPIIYIAYFPLYFILSIWLPEYIESLKYLVLVLPICFFDAKMQLLCNTYLKVLRREGYLFKINIFALFLSVLLGIMGGIVFKSIIIVMLGMVLAIIVRSILAEYRLSKDLNIKIYKNIIQEIIFTIGFIVIAWYLDNIKGFFILISTYVFFILFNKKIVKYVLINIGGKWDDKS